MKLLKAATAALLFATGCGGSDITPKDACQMDASAECSRIYACYTAAELAAANYPATESACVTMNETAAGCDAKTTANACTGGNEVYQPDKVGPCIDQINGLTCAQIRTSPFVLETVAPACAEVCIIPG